MYIYKLKSLDEQECVHHGVYIYFAVWHPANVHYYILYILETTLIQIWVHLFCYANTVSIQGKRLIENNVNKVKKVRIEGKIHYYVFWTSYTCWNKLKEAV